jgi:hypothetical protein
MKKVKTYYYLETIDDFKSLIGKYVIVPIDDMCFKITEQGLVSDDPVSSHSWQELERILIHDPLYKFYYEEIHDKEEAWYL